MTNLGSAARLWVGPDTGLATASMPMFGRDVSFSLG
jgi:hypothetical protein